MKDIIRINILLDFYSPLLTEHQVKILELYASDDYSLSEIAELTSISRQGVYDNINRATKQLEEYESKLNLYRKYAINKERALQIEENIKNRHYDKISSIVSDIVER
ncbi:MAG: putative DNA-binding protein [Clostridia bacterium]|nr:putative DNA-binding protein [Clostridia bacterium]